MTVKNSYKVHMFRYVFLLLIGFVLLWMFNCLGSLQGVNHYFYDLSFRLRGEHIPDERIIICAIDEKTLGELGRWPISRSYYVDFLERTVQADVVGLDLIMAESSPDDQDFAEAVIKHGRVVMPVYFDKNLKVHPPVSPISPAGLGHAHLDPDTDGVTRCLFHTISGNSSYSSFSLAIAGRAQKFSFSANENFNQKEESVVSGTLSQTDPMYINFYGGPETFLHLSFVDIINGKWSTDYFKDKILLVGITVPGIEEGVLTPFDQGRKKTSGVEVQAQIIRNLLDGNSINKAGNGLQLSVAFLLTALCFTVSTRFNSASASIVALVLIGVIISIDYILFSWGNFWVAPAFILLAVLMSLFFGYLFYLERLGDFLRQAKQDWESSFNSIRDGIIICDENAQIVKMNMAASEMLDPHLSEQLKKYFGSQENNTSLLDEYFYEEKNKYFSVHAQNRFDEKKRLSGKVIVVRDITAQHEAEKNQRQMEEDLFQAHKMEAIGTLAGGIAHDFNNILSAIVGYSEMAKLSCLPGSDATKNIDQVLKASKRATDLVKHILSVSRSSDHFVESFAPHLIIKEALKMLRASMPTTVTIQEDIDRECGNIMADSTNIHQLIVNLCTNSLHAMENEKGVLSVSLYRKEISDAEIAGEPGVSPGQFVVLQVSDTGHGMDKATLDRIFDPYFTTKEIGKGTGLGLAFIHGIISDYHGFTRVESELGKGTTFYVHIPALQEETSFVEDIEMDEPLPTGSEHIMVVDDESMIADINKSVLEKLGYKVTSLTHSLDALKKIRAYSDQFDLIITDQTMPDLTGVELAQEILKIKADMPIILSTGYSSVISEEECLAIGIKKYMRKPVDRKILAKIVRQMLDEN